MRLGIFCYFGFIFFSVLLVFAVVPEFGYPTESEEAIEAEEELFDDDKEIPEYEIPEGAGRSLILKGGVYGGKNIIL